MEVTKIAGSDSAAKGNEVFRNTVILVGKNVGNETVNNFASSLKRYGVNTDVNSYATDNKVEGLYVIAGKSVYTSNEALEAALVGVQRGKLTEDVFHSVMRDRFNPVMSHLEGAENVRTGNVRIYSLFD